MWWLWKTIGSQFRCMAHLLIHIVLSTQNEKVLIIRDWAVGHTIVWIVKVTWSPWKVICQNLIVMLNSSPNMHCTSTPIQLPPNSKWKRFWKLGAEQLCDYWATKPSDWSTDWPTDRPANQLPLECLPAVGWCWTRKIHIVSRWHTL